jgi:RNA polymerase sigma factor (sigma-70 family)
MESKTPCQNRSERSYLDDYFVAHRASLLNFANRRLRNLSDAEDAVSELYLAAASSPTSSTITGQDLINWLFRVLINICCQIANKRKREEPSSDSDIFESLCDRDTEDWISVELHNKAKQRLRCISLQEKTLKCLLLKISGRKRAQIAKELGITEREVKTELEYAVSKLRNIKIWDTETTHSAEHLFYFCSRVHIYIPPTKTGAALSNEKLRRMK